MLPFAAVGKPSQLFRYLFYSCRYYAGKQDESLSLPGVHRLQAMQKDSCNNRQYTQSKHNIYFKNIGKRPHWKRIQLLLHKDEIQISSQPRNKYHCWNIRFKFLSKRWLFWP